MKSRKARRHMHSWRWRKWHSQWLSQLLWSLRTKTLNTMHTPPGGCSFNRWHMHTLEAASEHQTRPGWVFTSPVALISGNFRQISSSWYSFQVRGKKTVWEFKTKSAKVYTVHISDISLAMDFVYSPFIKASSRTEIKWYLLSVSNPSKLIIIKHYSSNKEPLSVQDV